MGDTRRKDRWETGVTGDLILRCLSFATSYSYILTSLRRYFITSFHYFLASRLINPFNAIHASDFANTAQDGFELTPIDNLQIHINLRVQTVRAAL